MAGRYAQVPGAPRVSVSRGMKAINYFENSDRTHKGNSRYDGIFQDPESVGLSYKTTHPAATDHSRNWFKPGSVVCSSDRYEEIFMVSFMAFFDMIRITTGDSSILVIERTHHPLMALENVDRRVAHPEAVSSERQTVVNFNDISTQYVQPFGDRAYMTPEEQNEKMGRYIQQIWSAYSCKLEMMARRHLSRNVRPIGWQIRDRPHLQKLTLSLWGMCQRYTDKPLSDVVAVAVQQFVVQGLLAPNAVSNAVVVVPILFLLSIMDDVAPQTKRYGRDEMTERPRGVDKIVGVVVGDQIMPGSFRSFDPIKLPNVEVVGYETVIDPQAKDPWTVTDAAVPCAICFQAGTREVRVKISNHSDIIYNSLDLLRGSGMYPILNNFVNDADVWTNRGRANCANAVDHDWPCRGCYPQGTVGCTPMYAHDLAAMAASRSVFEQYVNAAVNAGATELTVFSQFIRQNTGLNTDASINRIVNECKIYNGHDLPPIIVAPPAPGNIDPFAYHLALTLDPSRVFAVQKDVENKEMHDRDIAAYVRRHIPLAMLCALFENESQKLVPNFATALQYVSHPPANEGLRESTIVAAFVQIEGNLSRIFIESGLGLLHADVSLPFEVFLVASHAIQLFVTANHKPDVARLLANYRPTMPSERCNTPDEWSAFYVSVRNYNTPLIKATLATLAGMVALTDTTTISGLAAAQETQVNESIAAMQTLTNTHKNHIELTQLRATTQNPQQQAQIDNQIAEFADTYRDDAINLNAKCLFHNDNDIVENVSKLERFRSTDFSRYFMASVKYTTKITWELRRFGLAFLFASLPCTDRVLEFLNRICPYTAFGGSLLLFVTATTCPIFVTSKEANTVYLSDTHFTQEPWRDYSQPRMAQLDVRCAFWTKSDTNSMMIDTAHISAMTIKSGIAPPYKISEQVASQTSAVDFECGATVIYGGYHGVNLQPYCQRNCITRIPPKSESGEQGPYWDTPCPVAQVAYELIGEGWYADPEDGISCKHIVSTTPYMPMSGSIISGACGVDRVEQLEGLGQDKFSH